MASPLDQMAAEKNNKHKIHLIRYADDFVVTANCKEILEHKVKPLIEEFLSIRGLQLSPEKTRITHITEGFNTKLDRILWRNIWNWARRRHNNLGYREIVSLLFMRIGKRKWQFFGKFNNGNITLLRMFALFKIRRHKLIRGEANPFNPEWNTYLFNRRFCKTIH